MFTSLPKVVAHFETGLAAKITAAATTATLISVLDKYGSTISGYVGVTLDEGTTLEEECLGTLSGSTLTFALRGLDPQDPTTARTTLKFEHRRGASVKITDAPVLAIVRLLLNGELSLPNILLYATDLVFTDDKQLIPKKYADGLAIAGSPKSATTVNGIGKVSVAPVDSVNPIFVGDNDGRLSTQAENDAQNATTAPSSTNKFITQKDFQKNAENYVVATGSANAYVGTHSPVPAALAAGMHLSFKANFTNTSAVTYNPNSLGATAIKKNDGATALAAGDIVNGQIVHLMYDGTNFQMLSPIGTPYVPGWKNGTATKSTGDASTTQTIAHGLGAVPKYVRLTLMHAVAVGYPAQTVTAVYNGATQSSITARDQGGTSWAADTAFKISNGGISTDATQTGVITVDSTNITITWTKTNSSNAVSFGILWEAFA